MKFDAKKAELLFFLTAITVGALYLFSNYGKTLLSVISPFAIALVFAELLKSPLDILSKKLHISRRLLCMTAVPCFYLALFAVLSFIVFRMISELSSLAAGAQLIEEKIPYYIGEIKEFAGNHIPGFSESSLASKDAAGIISSLIAGFASSLTVFLTDTAGIIPKIMLYAVVTVIATCYFTADRAHINRFFLYQFPLGGKVFLSQCKLQFLSTTSKYLKAYFTIAAITFLELLTGLLFIRREYAFVLALVITVVDILPVLGTGVVLIPWAVFEGVFGSMSDCIKLAALYVFITVMRQIIEPRILGSFIGLYPLLTLFAVYAGVKLCGITGVFLFPVIAIVIRNLNEKGIIRLYKNPPDMPQSTLMAARTKYRKFRNDK